MKSPNTLLAALLLLSASSAIAASSVDLSVHGLITPSACEPGLSNGGNVDLGKLSAKDLNVETTTNLQHHVLQLNVKCEAATLLALEPRDNRAGSGHDETAERFGLGLINDDEKLGDMALALLNANADGAASRTITSWDNGLTWHPSAYFRPGEILSFAMDTVNAPTPVRQLFADFYVMPRIAPAKDLTLDSEVTIDGSVTLTVKYL
ncbi:hypothetical protein A986_11054 [Pseudomonas fluorescens BRIP34879]|uniref:DUF1120 domain-containing protein n=1 Tax=Pseudomonas poae TaxID=200451 RepID=UPI0002A78D16|nr:DUF1120 domain-containing protein [Pseudomonas poae]ELQ17052.1 hypothetical protein A986_11054 [Pseudomonas fluorescens BRIP34879]MBC3195218.1 DUF1120 domain-containing protein [Pseudomonas poae]